MVMLLIKLNFIIRIVHNTKVLELSSNACICRILAVVTEMITKNLGS